MGGGAGGASTSSRRRSATSIPHRCASRAGSGPPEYAGVAVTDDADQPEPAPGTPQGQWQPPGAEPKRPLSPLGLIVTLVVAVLVIGFFVYVFAVFIPGWEAFSDSNNAP
jgi:hypothetical protein